MILIISDIKKDPHAIAVSKELNNREIEFINYDPINYPLSSTVSIEFKQDKLISILTSNDSEIDLSQIQCVWYRRPGEFTLPKSLHIEEADWLREECTHLFRALWSNMNTAFWISKPENIRQASLKLFQIRLAIEIGFSIPDLMVTNNVKRATSFLNSNPDGVIVKSLARSGFNTKEGGITLYTHLITKKDQEQIESVKYGPTFLQKNIPKKNGDKGNCNW